jgi:hypothetical protein
MEEAKNRAIDDDVELDWVPGPQEHDFQRGNDWNHGDEKSMPPAQKIPPKVYQKDAGRRASIDSDYV